MQAPFAPTGSAAAGHVDIPPPTAPPISPADTRPPWPLPPVHSAARRRSRHDSGSAAPPATADAPPAPPASEADSSSRHQIVHPHETAGVAPLLPCQLPQQAAGSHIRGAGGIGQIGPPVRQLILDEVLNEPDAAMALPARQHPLSAGISGAAGTVAAPVLSGIFSALGSLDGSRQAARTSGYGSSSGDTRCQMRSQRCGSMCSIFSICSPPFFSHYSMLRREKTSLSIAFSRKLC